MAAQPDKERTTSAAAGPVGGIPAEEKENIGRGRTEDGKKHARQDWAEGGQMYPSTGPTPDTTPRPTFEQACEEIGKGIKKLTEAGMGGGEAGKLACMLWGQLNGVGGLRNRE